MSTSLLAALLMALVCGAGGWFVPAIIARIPEPEPSEDEPSAKEPYVDVAALPGLAPRSAAVAALAGALVGWTLGLVPALPLLAYVVVVGVALAVVDWRTRLLPTKVIAPSYAVVLVLLLVAVLPGRDWDGLAGAAVGWAVYGGWFLLTWLLVPAWMGYGDVRLSGLLGIVLGLVGWGALVVGIMGGIVLGAVVGSLLAVLGLVERRSYPFGPFMLAGALLGIVLGAWFEAFYGPQLEGFRLLFDAVT